jgi:hypothetical protein
LKGAMGWPSSKSRRGAHDPPEEMLLRIRSRGPPRTAARRYHTKPRRSLIATSAQPAFGDTSRSDDLWAWRACDRRPDRAVGAV